MQNKNNDEKVEPTILAKFLLALLIIIVAVSLFYFFKAKFFGEKAEEPIPWNASFPPDDPWREPMFNLCYALKENNISYCNKINISHLKGECIDRYWMKQMFWENNPDYCANMVVMSEEECRKDYQLEIVERDCSVSVHPDAVITCRASISRDYTICFEHENNSRALYNCRLLTNDPSLDCETDTVRDYESLRTNKSIYEITD